MQISAELRELEKRSMQALSELAAGPFDPTFADEDRWFDWSDKPAHGGPVGDNFSNPEWRHEPADDDRFLFTINVNLWATIDFRRDTSLQVAARLRSMALFLSQMAVVAETGETR